MQLFKSIRKTRLTTVSILLLIISGVTYADPIGDIVESTGIGQIVRNNEIQSHDVGFAVELYDVAETVNGRMKIEFLDEEELDLIEHTEVYIDEVYYDPNPSLSKMSLRMVQGTARFASGKGNKIKKANIDISTPTAQIAINGTDFTTTIDELGRTLVILLPDEDGVTPSGEIVVSNEGGSVTLNEAYQATMVSTIETPPTGSVVISNLTTGMIDNMFIVSPPQEVAEAVEEQAREDMNDDQGVLDVDFLEFNELEKDYDDYAEDPDYDARGSRLDIDYLDVDFLTDVLDVVEALTKTTAKFTDRQQVTGGVRLDGAQFGFNKDSQFNVFEEDGNLVFFREVNGIIEIIIQQGNSGYLDLRLGGYEGVIEFGGGDPAIQIIINQNN
tara:strand:+ start:2723 stop:3880 length:1158 start_codon:yes stop_codon:yes gene_type:complete